MKLTAKTLREPRAFKYAHAKLDGHQLRLTDGRFYSTHPHDLTEELAWMRLPTPPGEYVGELWVPGHKASDVKTAINERWPTLRWSVFAVPHLHEWVGLEECASYCERRGLDFAPFLSQPNVAWLMGQKELPVDCEGWVFKNGNLLDWHKWKPVKTIDLIVCDLKDGNGKYAGLVGALVCLTTEGYAVASVSGMTDDERLCMGIGSLGRVVEVAYQYVGGGGRLRHPRFVRFRDDKTPPECTADQDEELAEYWKKS